MLAGRVLTQAQRGFPIADTFTDNNGVGLAAHNPKWIKHTGAGDSNSVIQSNRVYCGGNTGSDAAYWYYNTAPNSPNYSIEAVLVALSDTSNAGVLGRVNAGAGTMYRARIIIVATTGLDTIQLSRIVLGTGVVLGTASIADFSGSHTLKLVMSGGIVTTGLQVFYDGASVINTTDATPIAATGFAGIYLQQSNSSAGLHIDSFSAFH